MIARSRSAPGRQPVIRQRLLHRPRSADSGRSDPHGSTGQIGPEAVLSPPANLGSQSPIGPPHHSPVTRGGVFKICHGAHYAIRLQNELFRPCSPRSLIAYASCVSNLSKSRIDEARLAHSIK